MKDNDSPSSPKEKSTLPFSPDLKRIIAFSAVIAMIAFLLEQLANLGTNGAPWEWIVALPYTGIYIISISIGIGIACFVFRFLPIQNHPKGSLVFGLIYLFFFLALNILIGLNHEDPLPLKWYIRLGMISVGIVGILILYGASRFKKISALYSILYLGFILIWIIACPESILGMVASYWWLVHILAIGFFGYFAYHSISWGRKPKLEQGTIFILFLLNLILITAPFLVRENTTEKNNVTKSQMPAGSTPDRQTPVIVIVLDTLRSQNMSLYGYEHDTTPFLEELASECMVFTRFKSVSSWTLPSHASLFTGLRPFEHMADDHYRPDLDPPINRTYPIPASIPTLAEILKSRGYRTGAVASNRAFITPDYGMDRGFEYFCNAIPSHELTGIKSGLADVYFRTGLSAKIANLLGFPLWDYLHRYAIRFIDAEEVNQLAETWLDENAKEKSFFLFLNYMETHFPLYYPEAYSDLVHPEISISVDYGKLEPDGIMTHREESPSGNALLSADDVQRLQVAYDRALRYLDDSLREFFTYLREKNLFDSSLIIILSDHGEFLGEQKAAESGEGKLIEHRNGRLYEEVVAVPLLIKTPFSLVKGKVDSLSQTHEIFHYILRFTETGSPVEYSWPVPDSTHPVYSEFHRSGSRDWLPQLGDALALWEDNLKMIVGSDRQPEIYDLAKDPSENSNLVKSSTQHFDEKTSKANRQLKEILDYGLEHNPYSETVGEEDLERLRSLGYLD